MWVAWARSLAAEPPAPAEGAPKMNSSAARPDNSIISVSITDFVLIWLVACPSVLNVAPHALETLNRYACKIFRAQRGVRDGVTGFMRCNQPTLG